MTAAASAAERRSVALRLALFYVAFFLFVGVGLPFWPAWLSARGLSAAEIGFLLSLAPWMKLVGNPFTTRLADATGRTRPVLLAVAFSGMVFYLLFTLAFGFWPLLAVTVLAGLSIGALTPLADALTMGMATSHGIDYGRVRLWGSLAFILAGVAGGWLLAGRSPDLILSLVLATLAMTVAACMLLPESAPSAHRVATAGWGRLLLEPGFLLFILAAGLIQSSHAMLYGFGTIHWLAVGYDKDTIGLLWAVGVAVEVGLFAAGRRLLHHIGPVGLLLIGRRRHRPLDPDRPHQRAAGPLRRPGAAWADVRGHPSGCRVLHRPADAAGLPCPPRAYMERWRRCRSASPCSAPARSTTRSPGPPSS
jgi:PPP family 3-phenylpropionic acid transporter